VRRFLAQRWPWIVSTAVHGVALTVLLANLEHFVIYLNH